MGNSMGGKCSTMTCTECAGKHKKCKARTMGRWVRLQTSGRPPSPRSGHDVAVIGNKVRNRYIIIKILGAVPAMPALFMATFDESQRAVGTLNLTRDENEGMCIPGAEKGRHRWPRLVQKIAGDKPSYKLTCETKTGDTKNMNGTAAAAGTSPHTATLTSPLCSKQFHRHHNGRPAPTELAL